MNCIEAQALVSAAHDGELIGEAELAAAQKHCAECEDCTAFVAGMRYLDVLPAPSAPTGMAERVMDAVAPLAAERTEERLIQAERAEAESVGTEAPQPESAAEVAGDAAPTAMPFEYSAVSMPAPSGPGAGGFSWFVGPIRWATLGAATALAATALVAFVVIGLNGNTPASRRSTATSGVESTVSPDFTYSGGAAQDGQIAGAAPNKAPAQAPDYVMYKDFVYAPGALIADASSATPTIGTLSTAFASGGAPQQVTVYRSPLSDGSIVVQGPDGLRLYAPVIRMLTSVRYQLTSGKAVDHFGVWPVLPDRFPAPTNSAGTPSFVTAGTDALSVPIYSATGRPVTEGFAVAPVTATTDPAGGNPNWTWWAPAPANP